MKARSAKNKGALLQKIVAEKIIKLFSLSPNDVKSAIMGESGMDIKLADNAREKFPFAVECKNLQRVAIYKYFKQAKDNAEELTPLLILKQNRSQPLAVLSLEDFFTLLENKDNESK